MFTKNDLEQINKKGIDIKLIEQQLEHFKNGFAFAELHKAATIDNGIIQASPQDHEHYINLYNKALKNGLNTIKFVPASGAATRMFKALFEFLNANEEQKEVMMQQAPYDVFFAHIRQFAFIDDLEKALQKRIDTKHIDTKLATQVVEHLLLGKGLNYGSLPKGLLKFHMGSESALTPLEEHLKEAAQYAKVNGKAKIHFTISPEHEELFKQQLEAGKEQIEAQFSVKFDVSFSFQKPSTDTIAVNPDNTPFRNNEAQLLFRPGGHGALIENLNDLQEELVFIKNIDNVVPQHLQKDTVAYKQVLAGIVLDKQAQISDILKGLEQVSDEATNTGVDFLVNELQMERSAIEQLSYDDKRSLLLDKLNRPIRVCGMVKNEGEPGGGPFWVKQKDDSINLQIVEGAQIDPNNAEQQAILKASTHFNPVDLVCYTKDYKGQKFDLTKFVNPETGFISEKTQNGNALKALELPGLWNGAMAHWLTFFVEVPISTFNPVKTVMDLLRPQHQPEK
ncbi:DUF4301 family protein [Carboxylicivirga sediminis]|uniref:DUF4301 family protein n=1 Tax=Carboxylicivirga sediminis TaxID=2006564 RepID=A0A941IYK7_9BACT|nr:DUF4301 family protein [Carboxylicivirga sediminis]MBR8537991.1 DUF4301 family protein [Carboxylicivirga sediminis]